MKRINSSGEIIDNGDYTSTDGSATNVTGFIPVKSGDVIRGGEGIVSVGATSGYTRIAYYDSSKNYLSYEVITVNNSNVTLNADGSFEHTVSVENAAFCRVTATGINADAIITVNEKIE
jgi:hypothetical protein